METIKNHIVAVTNTMDTVDVRGVENMRKMVLCYDTLKYITENLNAPSEPDADDAKEDVHNG